MPRYIDAYKLYDRFEIEYNVTGGITHKILSHVLDKIAEADDEDVEPVRHAHWIEKNNPNFSPFDGSSPYIFYCSHCGKIDGDKYPFCHVCGFKMDEEEVK